MWQVASSVSLQDGNTSQRKASVVQTVDDPTKNALVVANPDWSNIVAERLSNLWTDITDATYFYSWYTKVGTTERRIERTHKTTYDVAWASWTTTPDTNRTNRKALTYNTAI